MSFNLPPTINSTAQNPQPPTYKVNEDLYKFHHMIDKQGHAIPWEEMSNEDQNAADLAAKTISALNALAKKGPGITQITTEHLQKVSSGDLSKFIFLRPADFQLQTAKDLKAECLELRDKVLELGDLAPNSLTYEILRETSKKVMRLTRQLKKLEDKWKNSCCNCAGSQQLPSEVVDAGNTIKTTLATLKNIYEGLLADFANSVKTTRGILHETVEGLLDALSQETNHLALRDGMDSLISAANALTLLESQWLIVKNSYPSPDIIQLDREIEIIKTSNVSPKAIQDYVTELEKFLNRGYAVHRIAKKYKFIDGESLTLLAKIPNHLWEEYEKCDSNTDEATWLTLADKFLQELRKVTDFTDQRGYFQYKSDCRTLADILRHITVAELKPPNAGPMEEVD